MPTNDRMDEIAAKIDRGIRLIEHHFAVKGEKPPWHVVNLGTLDIRSPTKCPLSQLFGQVYYGVLPILQIPSGIPYGFDIDGDAELHDEIWRIRLRRLQELDKVATTTDKPENQKMNREVERAINNLGAVSQFAGSWMTGEDLRKKTIEEVFSGLIPNDVQFIFRVKGVTIE